MHDTTAVGQESESIDGRVWFLPSGVARGERNSHRLRGWGIAISAAVVLWGLIVLAVWAFASLL